MNIGPLGTSVRKAPIRKVSLMDAWTDPTAPPLIKSSVFNTWLTNRPTLLSFNLTDKFGTKGTLFTPIRRRTSPTTLLAPRDKLVLPSGSAVI